MAGVISGVLPELASLYVVGYWPCPATRRVKS